MKKTLFVLLALTSGFMAFSQNPANNKEAKKEKIKALYVAFITKELNLNEEEAQKFWPVYNLYQSELKAVRKERKEAAANRLEQDAREQWNKGNRGIHGDWR